MRTRHALAVLTVSILGAPTASSQVVCSQSVNNTTVGCCAIACFQSGFTNAAGTMRRYSFPTSCAVAAGQPIQRITFGVQEATAGPGQAGVQPISVRLYSLDPTATLTFANMTLLHDQVVQLPDMTDTIHSQQLSTPVVPPTGQDVVVEVFADNGVSNQSRYRHGHNTLGELADTYLYLPNCGQPQPQPMTSINVNWDYHAILDLEFGVSLQSTPFCNALPNSIGAVGTLTAAGSNVVADNSLVLSVSQVPPGQFGIFVVSDSANASIQLNQGVLCLSGFVGRFSMPNQIWQADPGGQASLAIDLTIIPASSSLVNTNPGDTWFFQAWHRDFPPTPNQLGSNFTTGLEITFN